MRSFIENLDDVSFHLPIRFLLLKKKFTGFKKNIKHDLLKESSNSIS